jgi:cellulose synthase/poly-beta-1,6-N-acetylglucosamine synthase-like glycosyltransferase
MTELTDYGVVAFAANVIAWLVISVALIQNGAYLIQLVIAHRSLVREPPQPIVRTLWRRSLSSAPPIALLAPAYNEAATIKNSIQSLLGLDYPGFEVIVINDGSKDATLDVLRTAFQLRDEDRDYEAAIAHKPIRGIYRSATHPKLLVIDKVNGGKADALNAGLNLARAPIVCSIDADSLLESDALLRAVQPFVEDPQRVIATGGTVRVVNGCSVVDGRVMQIGLPKNIWALFQTVEYLRAFLLARLAWSRMGVLTIVSGAFGLFRRSVLVEAGGYASNTVGEDMEIVVRLHRRFREMDKPYRIAFVPEPVCWTEVPETLQMLSRQRSRWHRGALETFATHRDMLFNPKYGRAGMLGMGKVFFFDVLAPVVELAGYILMPVLWLMGLLSFEFFAAYLAAAFAFGVAISVGSLAIEEAELRRFPKARDLVILAGAAVLENFGYRQLNSYWRIKGMLQWLRGEHSWGSMTRRGFSAKGQAAA